MSIFGIGCISFDSYIKPQRLSVPAKITASCISFDSYIKPQPSPLVFGWFFVVYLLIPTSNHNHLCFFDCIVVLYIFWFLHQTTTFSSDFWMIFLLYIFWFLHQTTTCSILDKTLWRCISFDSYIKPQLKKNSPPFGYVVYLLIPTSNHNPFPFPFLFFVLYIFWFLHQTTTYVYLAKSLKRCISFDSYIKPQLVRVR